MRKDAKWNGFLHNNSWSLPIPFCGYKSTMFWKITMQNCNSNFIKSSLFLHCGSFHRIWLVFVLFDKVRLGVTTYLTRSLFSYLHCVKEDFSTMQWQHSGPEFYETSSHLIMKYISRQYLILSLTQLIFSWILLLNCHIHSEQQQPINLFSLKKRKASKLLSFRSSFECRK